MITFRAGTATIANEPGIPLPVTGGRGTTGLKMIGLALLATAALGIGMQARRRRPAPKRAVGRSGPHCRDTHHTKTDRAPMVRSGLQRPPKKGGGGT